MTLGETLIVPLVPTVPTLGWIVHEVALVEVQERVEDWPLVMLTGLAEMVTVGGGGSLTAMVTLLRAVPPGPVAVML